MNVTNVLLWMPIFLQCTISRQIEFEGMFLENFGDSAVVGLQLHLELVQLQVQLPEVTIHQSVTLLGDQDLLV